MNPETRKKISKSIKKYIEKNPNKIGHHSYSPTPETGKQISEALKEYYKKEKENLMGRK